MYYPRSTGINENTLSVVYKPPKLMPCIVVYTWRSCIIFFILLVYHTTEKAASNQVWTQAHVCNSSAEIGKRLISNQSSLPDKVDCLSISI